MHIEKRLKEGHSADHERDWQPYPVDPSSAICDRLYIRTDIQHCRVRSEVFVTSIIIEGGVNASGIE